MLRDISVVVVDDEIMSLKMARRVFDRAGIDGRYFCSGSEALAWLDGENVPDMILSDVHMPDIDGFDILNRLKAEPAYRNVPLVFLTGDEDVRTETEGLHAGAADFIRKPFAAEVLLKRVRNIIELNRLHERMADDIRAGFRRREGPIHPRPLLPGRKVREGDRDARRIQRQRAGRHLHDGAFARRGKDRHPRRDHQQDEPTDR